MLSLVSERRDQLPEPGGRLTQDGDALRTQQRVEVPWTTRHLLRDHHKAAAVQRLVRQVTDEGTMW